MSGVGENLYLKSVMFLARVYSFANEKAAT
jgi:hypothetical protein